MHVQAISIFFFIVMMTMMTMLIMMIVVNNYCITVPLIYHVREHVEYKVAMLTYKALNGLAPPYLSTAFTRVAYMPSRRRLRSASTDQLLVPSYQARWSTCLERSSLLSLIHI